MVSNDFVCWRVVCLAWAGSVLTRWYRIASHILNGHLGVLSTWCLISVARKDMLQCASTFQAFAYITFANIPSAKAIHTAKLRFTGWGNRPYFLCDSWKDFWPFIISHRESQLFFSLMCARRLEQALAKGQLVKIFSSVGHMVSVAATLLCPHSVRTARGDP